MNYVVFLMVFSGLFMIFIPIMAEKGEPKPSLNYSLHTFGGTSAILSVLDGARFAQSFITRFISRFS